MTSFFYFLIGSTHGFIDDFRKQKEVIEKVNPEYVLCEDLQNISLESEEDYSNMLESKKVSRMVSFDEVKKLVKLCFKRGVKLIGMDLLNYGLNEELQKKVKQEEELSEEENRELSEILNKRESHQLEIIKEYGNKSEKPIVVITGAWHLRKDSILLKNLEDYKLILPCDDRGRVLFKPSNKENIKYCVKRNEKVKT